jgi:PHP family Zn ribbon phosphoesterase
MQYICDLHIHSKYSRATSKETNIENLNKWARIKGVNVLATGDFTHPLWLKELKETLEPAENGLYRFKNQKSKIKMVSA